MEELVKRLESVDTQESAKAVSRLQKRLGSSREPQLLGELVDYFIASGSLRALRVLSSLKDVQSQDFFAKLNDCMHSKVPLRLPVLRLLAHSLNKQTSWLYKIVQHPLFTSILHCLKISHDVLVLTSGLLVLAAILPLAPCHLSRHLPDIFQIFADLATIRTTTRLRHMPKPLYLHLDVAVYYLFLQLYALFPCNFFTFLKGCYGPTGETGNFHQFIAPLFNYVRFHPGLVLDSNTIETQGDKWRSMEPDEIATLSLTMCLDLSIASPVLDHEDPNSSVLVRPGLGGSWEPAALTESSLAIRENQSLPSPLTNSLRIFPPQLPNSHPLPPLSDSSAGSVTLHSQHSSCYASEGTPSPVKGVSPRSTRKQRSQGTNGSIRDVPTVDGAVPSVDNQLGVGKEMLWSPSTMFDTSLSSVGPSRQQSMIGLLRSAMVTPSPENSASTSVSGTAHHTPRPMTAPTFTYTNNYSPTASLGSEPPSKQHSLQTTPSSSRSATRQSSQQFPDMLDGEDPFTNSNRLSKSLFSSPTSARSLPPQSTSLRNRFGRFLSIFSRKSSLDDHDAEEESFTEVSSSDLVTAPSSNVGQVKVSEKVEPGGGVVGVSGGRGEVEEVGIEAGEELLVGSGEQFHASSSDQGGAEEEEEIGNSSSSQESAVTDIPLPRSAATSGPRLPASFPRDGGQGEERLSRRRASHSDSVTHTVQQVQERLWELAESQKVDEEVVSTPKPSERRDTEDGEAENDDSSNTNPEARPSSGANFSDSVPGHFVSGSIPTVDSGHTLVNSHSNSSFFSSQCLAGLSKSFEANETGESPLPRSSSQRRNSGGLVMRRVSVCDRQKRPGVNFGTQTSSNGDRNDSLSPVVLLDRLIQHGEIVHEGRPQDIPLTELEGVDWFRFGGCPHGEELGQMQSQVALLHSQLLFERHQCLQHDRRSRRLLSQARTTHRVREQLEILRQQCWQESLMRRTLEQEVQGVRREAGEAGRRERRERLRDENRALSDKNTTLETENCRLTAELMRLQQENQKLTQEAKEMRERLFALESEQADVQPRLAQTDSLREKVSALERQVLVLSRLYQRQREEAQSLLARGRGRQELNLLTTSLREEKEAAEREKDKLAQETKGFKMMLASLEKEKQKAQEERNEVQQILQHVQGRCQEKIRASEEKYEAIVAVAHQLESHLTELRARSFASRKRPSPHRHKRSSSHPTVHRSLPAPTAPSPPITTHTTPSSLGTV